LYRIATNACLSALSRRSRRPLPSGLGPPSRDPYAPTASTPEGMAWLEPIPDGLVIDAGGDPAEMVVARQKVRLALVAGSQLLPPRQRAAFLLCEVLALPAAEAAAVLELSVAAVKSLLQRARARLADAELSDDDLAEPTDEGARSVLDRYLAAFERSDMDALVELLADEAELEMTGTTTWFSGKATCVPYIAAQAIGRSGDWRMLPLHVNGQLGGAAYHRAGRDYQPFAIVVLGTTATHLTRISLFADPGLFTSFDLPSTLTALP
jgi:RNA polymerase sigma-70 factor (ECF subfamily)